MAIVLYQLYHSIPVMYLFTEFPNWVIAIFSFFCLTQVRTWFEEITECFNEAKNSFMLKGTRYNVLPNRSFILDETLKAYGLDLNYKHKLN
ncbi:MAG: hypothetical protein JWP81_3850 [Ferruginibacter sp.]|nr:hypothetical protein [Ferruginibacter sp.]